jgi:malonyl-CoA/methylmalonyl-CoA synthetase
MISLFEASKKFKDKIAIIDNKGSHTYDQLAAHSDSFASLILDGNADLEEMSISFMVNPGFDYVCTQWAIWKAGGIAVPLCLSYPEDALKYAIQNTTSKIIICNVQYEPILLPIVRALDIKLIVLESITLYPSTIKLPIIDGSRNALILFTSGTTNLPKGVPTTHDIIAAQVNVLLDAWKWSDKDSTVCILPLHHVHGIINVLTCSLAIGATLYMPTSFSASYVFDLIQNERINLFMAVPTIYFKLISFWDAASVVEQKIISSSLSKLRLMISGSAALPVSILEKWKLISSHILLERYGMTEIGMAISNPYSGTRKAGYIGMPLPGVAIRLVDENGANVKEEEPGEIQVKGPTVFHGYWNNTKATEESFTSDKWFKTGDMAICKKGYYKILGRTSIDIIKSGGYKLSALEIEEVLRTFEGVLDCAVVGIENEEWGEIVGAAIVGANPIDKELLNHFMRSKMPSYKVPRHYIFIPELPRNAMGKVTKKDVKILFNN